MSNQPQFRYTQPPSKVIHVRNLPWECTDEELMELGKPFGKIINTKTNVGANRNQAFIEFADLNQAIAMISFYASSAEPAQVRGKTVYLQYSNRQEIVNNKAVGEVASNCLLVTIEGVQPDDVSIDVLHLVFSAFGFVHKIATFEKTAGYQALIQFSDAMTASSARDALDGRAIPRYLLRDDVGACTLKITFSGHTDLNVKFQSNRSRDYTNPYLPVAPSAIDGTVQDAKRTETESNVLLASVENMQYPVTIDTLHTIFSAYGFVQKIAIFEKNSAVQALIQYPDIQTANSAKSALEGHNIYEGGFCKLHLQYSRHTDLNVKINNDRGRDYTGGSAALVNNQPSILGPLPQPAVQPITSLTQPSSQLHTGADHSSAPSQATPYSSQEAGDHPQGVAHQFPGNGAQPYLPSNQSSESASHMPPQCLGLPQPFSGSITQFKQGHAGDQLSPSSQVMHYPGYGELQNSSGRGPQFVVALGSSGSGNQPSFPSAHYMSGEGDHQHPGSQMIQFSSNPGWQQVQGPGFAHFANQQFMLRGPGVEMPHYSAHGHMHRPTQMPGYGNPELPPGYDELTAVHIRSIRGQTHSYPNSR